MLKELYKYHKDWVRMVQSMGGGFYSEDIVQEAYIKIHLRKYELINDTGVNKPFMYVILYSVLIDYLRKKNKVDKIYIEEIKKRQFQEQMCKVVESYYNKLYEVSEDDNQNDEEREAFARVSEAIDKEKESWHWFNQKVYNMYTKPLSYELGQKTSIRKIGEITDISFVTIYHTLKKAKEQIKKNLKKEYDKYKNRE